MGPSSSPPPTWRLMHTVAAVIAVIAGIGVGLVVNDNGHGGHSYTVTVGRAAPIPTTSKVDSADPGRAPDFTVTAPAAAVRAAAANVPDLHARDEAPPGVSDAELNASQRRQEELAHNDQLPTVSPDAAPVQRGCVSRFVQNFSSRRGVAPRIWTLHYTVSHNITGWGDVDAIVNLFNTASAQASSNYVIDSEGHCAYIVRESDKAWTQAGGNPYSISVEVIAFGNETRYLAPAGLAKLDEVISDSAARWHIPIRRGAVSGCVPTRSGIIQHKDWGLCGGGHFDISPFPVDPVVASVQRWRAAHTGVSAIDKLRCRRLNAWRKAGRPSKGSHAAILRKRTLAAHHVYCQPNEPTHVIK